jgi:hypothetical protein
MYYAALKDGITLKVISSSRNFWYKNIFGRVSGRK